MPDCEPARRRIVADVTALLAEARQTAPAPGWWSCRIYASPLAVEAVLHSAGGQERAYRLRSPDGLAEPVAAVLTAFVDGCPAGYQASLRRALEARAVELVLLVEPASGALQVVFQPTMRAGEPLLGGTWLPAAGQVH
jgi:hypothetical protein